MGYNKLILLNIVSIDMIIGTILSIIIFAGGPYVYMSAAYMALAEKIGAENSWLAWIPIANMYLTSQMAGMHWWPIIPLLIALFITIFGINNPIILIFCLVVFAIFYFIWNWKIFKKVGRPGWWPLVLLITIPMGFMYLVIPGQIVVLIYSILLGIAAWGKRSGIQRISV